MDFPEFMKAIKTVTTLPEEYFRTHLANAVKFSEETTRRVFFLDLPVQPYADTNKAEINDQLQLLAITYIANLISKSTAYGFNKTIAGGTETLIDNWFLRNSNTVGQNLLVDYLLQPNLLGRFEPDRAALAKSIADNAASNEFLTAFLVDCDTLQSMLPAKLLLLMLQIIDKKGPNFRKVHQVWVGNERWEILKDFETAGWLDVTRKSFQQNMPLYAEVNPRVLAAITKADPPKIEHKEDANWHRHTTTTTLYGMAVQNWVGNLARPNGMFSGTWADNVVVTDKSDDGCLAEGTQILLANGEVKNIENLEAGDLLLTANNSTAVFTGEIILNDKVKALYSVNDDSPFLSFEHVIMTQRGWCSLSPKSSMENLPHLEVLQLEIGDVIWKVKSTKGKAVTYEKVIVEKINIHDCNIHGPLKAYAIHLRGDKTNHANGYCCHSGYPDLSTTYVAANVASKMGQSEQVKFYKKMEEMAPQLEKALGKGPYRLAMLALKDASSASSKAAHTDKNGRLISHNSNLKNIVAPNYVLRYKAGDSSITDAINDFSIMNGHCYINGKLVETQTHGQVVSWSRDIEGQKEDGSIKLQGNGWLGRGHITRGGLSASFMVEIMNSYEMHLGYGQERWLNLNMGYKPDAQGISHPFGNLEDPADPSRNEDLQANSRVIFSEVKETGAFKATISFDPTYCEFGESEYIAAELTFQPNYLEFSGELVKYDVEKDDYYGEKIAFSGSFINKDSFLSLKKQLTQKMYQQELQTSNLTKTCNSTSPLIQNSAFAAMSKIKEPGILANLSIPDRALIQNSTFGKLKELMLLALSEKDKQTFSFFGETAPTKGPNGDLSEQMAALADDEKMKTFLTDKFAVGYLTQAFITSTDEKIKPKFDVIPNKEDKLAFFWKGKDKACFGADPQYNIASAKLHNYVYAENVPDLEAYILDGGEKWAEELYNYLTYPPTLLGLAMSDDIDNKRRITHLCSILQALDSKGRIKSGDKLISYSTALYGKIIERRLSDFMVKSKVAGAEQFNEFLTEYFKQYIQSILDPTSGWSSEVRAQAKKDLDELRELMQVASIADLSSAMTSIISNSTSFIANMRHGPIAKKVNDWAKEYAQRSAGKDKAIKVGKLFGNVLTMGVYAFGMSQIIEAFLNWDKLSAPQQVSLVATTLSMSTSIFSDILSSRAAKLMASSDAKFSEIIKAQNYLKDNIEAVDLLHPMDEILIDGEVGVAGMDAPSLVRAGRSYAQALAEAQDAEILATKWTKIAAVGEGVAKTFGILALGASIVASGFSIAKDFEEGQYASVIAMDIISEISNALALILEVGSGIAQILIIDVVAAVPIIGAVAAVVGIIVSIVMLFIDRKPPPSPVELFVKNVCVPFLEKLPMPDKKFLDEQAKIANHLSGGKTNNIMQVLF